jgi:hypothetical protein
LYFVTKKVVGLCAFSCAASAVYNEGIQSSDTRIVNRL